MPTPALPYGYLARKKASGASSASGQTCILVFSNTCIQAQKKAALGDPFQQAIRLQQIAQINDIGFRRLLPQGSHALGDLRIACDLLPLIWRQCLKAC